MLIKPDKNDLGDKRLSAEEGVIKKREECLTQASAHRIAGQNELEDPERSAGPRLYYTEVIQRIRKAAGYTADGNPRVQILDGSPGNVAIYRIKHRGEYDGSEFLETRRPPNGLHPDFFKDHVYVTGMPKDWLPEYSHVILDTSLLPVREIRGWRSVVMALIKSGALTYQQAINQFGEAVGERSGRWHEQLRPYRYGVNHEQRST